MTDLDVAVSLEVKTRQSYCTNTPQSAVDGELAGTFDDYQRAWRQRKPDDERRQHDAREFRREGNRFHSHSEKLSELHVHCL